MALISLDEETIMSKLVNTEINKICRSCLAVGGEMTSIFNSCIDSTLQIKEMIALVTHIEIGEDSLPNQICMNCASQATVGYHFKIQTQRADEILKQFFNLSLEKKLNTFTEPDRLLHDDMKNVSNTIYGPIHLSDQERKDNNKELENVNDCLLKNQNEDKCDTNFSDDKSIPSDNKNIIETRSTYKRKQKILNLEPLVITISCYDKNELKDEFCVEEDVASIKSDDHNNYNSEDEKSETEQLKKQIRDRKTKQIKNHNTEDSKQSLFINPNAPQCCSVCKDSFPNMTLLIKHRAQNHAPKKFQCQTCGNGFTTTRGLRIHLRLHTGEKPEICSVCNKAFADPRTLRNHERIHSGNHPFPCEQCHKRFPARLPLLYHMRSHTGERPHKCHLCTKSYIQQNSLLIHLRTHTGEKPYVCEFCDKRFTNATSLSLHQLTHNGVKNFQCTVCGKRVARSGELTVHLRTHTGEKPYSCSQCNKSFTNSSALRAHMPKHTGIKNFVCAVCGKRVARAMELQIHMRTHTGEKNFACSFCDKRFSTSSNLRLHERKHTGEKPYSCSMCDRAFADSHVLKNHMRTHTGERPFACSLCGNAFAQQTSLKTHMKSHTNTQNQNSVTRSYRNSNGQTLNQQTTVQKQEVISNTSHHFTDLHVDHSIDTSTEQSQRQINHHGIIQLPVLHENTEQMQLENSTLRVELMADQDTVPVIRNNLSTLDIDTNVVDGSNEESNMRQCLLIGDSTNQNSTMGVIQNDELRHSALVYDDQSDLVFNSRLNTARNLYTFAYQQ